MTMFGFPVGPGAERTPFPVVWEALTTRPMIVDGYTEGWYVQAGGALWVHIYVLMGASTTFGTGNWTFRLPMGMEFPVRNYLRGGGSQKYVTDPTQRAQQFGIVGMASSYDNSADQSHNGFIIPSNANPQSTAPDSVGIQKNAELVAAAWTNTQPFTWAVDDTLSLNFMVPLL